MKPGKLIKNILAVLFGVFVGGITIIITTSFYVGGVVGLLVWLLIYCLGEADE